MRYKVGNEIRGQKTYYVSRLCVKMSGYYAEGRSYDGWHYTTPQEAIKAAARLRQAGVIVPLVLKEDRT